MKYFGILNKEDIEVEINIIESKYDNDFNEEFPQNILDKCREKEIENLLIDKGIFKMSFVNDKMLDYELDIYNSETAFSQYLEPTFDDFETYLDIPYDLSEEVYKTIYELYIFKVEQIKEDFFSEFEENTFGLDYQETKKAALIEFKRIFKTIKLSNPQKPFEIKTSNNEKILYTPSLLFKLYRELGSIKNKINTYSYLPFLFGDIDLYNEHPYYNEELINEITSFQQKLDILLELNKRYNFEKDIYFNKIFYYKLESIIYDSLFTISAAYVFTMYTINNFDIINRSKLESLFEFLIENKFYLGSAQELLDLINIKFDKNLNTLKKHKEVIGISAHKTRVENFNNEWINFNKKYFSED